MFYEFKFIFFLLLLYLKDSLVGYKIIFKIFLHCALAFNVMSSNQMLTRISFPCEYLGLFCLKIHFFFIFKTWWFYSCKSWTWPLCSIFPSVWEMCKFRSSFVLRRSLWIIVLKIISLLVFCSSLLSFCLLFYAFLYFTWIFLVFWILPSSIFVVFLALPILSVYLENQLFCLSRLYVLFYFIFLSSNSILHLSCTYLLLFWDFEFLVSDAL